MSCSHSDIADSWEEVLCRKQSWCQKESWPEIQHVTQYMWSMLLPKNVGMKLGRQLDKQSNISVIIFVKMHQFLYFKVKS